jgi:hypothetical protein
MTLEIFRFQMRLAKDRKGYQVDISTLVAIDNVRVPARS